MTRFLSDDELLIEQLRAGVEAAFHDIYRRYWQTLYITARRKLGSEEQAKEVVQDIFLDLWERRENLEVQDLQRYLLRAVKYKVINQIRSRIIQKKFEAYSVYSQTETHFHEQNLMGFEDLSLAVNEAVSALPPKTKEIFVLNRFENKSAKEISSLLDVPERTVEYHITQSLRFLRQRLRDFVLPTTVLFSLSELFA